MLLLLLLAVLLVPPRQVEAAAPYHCADDLDCELLGECVAGVCRCRPGFTGPSCGSVVTTTIVTLVFTAHIIHTHVCLAHMIHRAAKHVYVVGSYGSTFA